MLGIQFHCIGKILWNRVMEPWKQVYVGFAEFASDTTIQLRIPSDFKYKLNID